VLLSFLDGKEVRGATVSYGESKWETPIVLTLEKDANYAFHVSFKDATGVEYAGRVQIAATWTGERTEQIALMAPTASSHDPLTSRPREITPAERRESAARWFQRGLWEAASGELQKLLDAGESLAEHAPKLITCLLNAHETPLESDVKRIETLLQQLELAGHADLAAPLRQQLQTKLPASRKKWWKI
jgi:hypothetical protein